MPLFNQLYNFAHWLAQNREEAEDLVQETYVKALRGFGSFQQGTNFRAWMYRILRNTFLTSRTGSKATMTVPLEEEEGPVAAATTTAHTPEAILIDRPSTIVRSCCSATWRKCRIRRSPRHCPCQSAPSCRVSRVPGQPCGLEYKGSYKRRDEPRS